MLILSFFILQTAHSQDAAFPRLEPDPKARQFFSPGGHYSWSELAEISLWASGDSANSSLERIHSLAQSLKNSNELPSSDREKAEFILTFLHSNILKTYSLYQTRVDTIFTNGRFNCVSSAVLYMILCDSLGINTSGVVTKDHALVIAHIDRENIDVETTNRFGFDPGNRREFHDQFGRTGFTYVPARNYRDRQTISKIELVSLILNNRISELERQNRFAEAVPLAIDRAVLLLGSRLSGAPQTAENTLFEDPRKSLTDRLLNYGAWLLRSNREEEGLRWAAAASQAYPDENRWQEFIFAAANNRIARFIRDNRTPEARNFLENQKNLLSQVNYTHLDSVLTDAELLRNANQIRTSDEGDSVITAIEKARTEGKMNERRANELIIFSVQKTAAALSSSPERNWREAIQYIEKSIAVTGSSRELEQALRNYRGNLAADYHNRFAAEWNSRNYDEAEKILNDGLLEFPNDRQLLSNKDIVSRRHSRQQ